MIQVARPDQLDELYEVELDADRRYLDVGHAEISNGSVVAASTMLSAIQRRELLVASTAGEVAGWVLLGQIGGERTIEQLCVARRHQSKGIGGMLLDAAIELARANGIASLLLNTQSDVSWNRPWYERHGFRVVPENEWSPGMREVADSQEAHGFNWSSRVHMRLSLGRHI
ncbi:GNAT family N-acetyltransferase [Nakamurella sp. GG22]